MQERIAAIIEEYDAQGEHRTGTAVDAHNAQWLAARMRAAGAEPVCEEFGFRRLQVNDARLRTATLDIAGVPLFDCLHTGPGGITGTLGTLGSAADIGVVMAQPLPGQLDDPQRKAAAQAIDTARKEARHKAIVLVSEDSRPAEGVATVNANDFLKPWGPPMLQIAHRDWAALQAACARGDQTTLVVDCAYVPATTCNVEARIAGSDPSLAPLIVMTPRSGWWACAAAASRPFSKSCARWSRRHRYAPCCSPRTRGTNSATSGSTIGSSNTPECCRERTRGCIWARTSRHAMAGASTCNTRGKNSGR